MVCPPGRDPQPGHWTVVPPVDDELKDAVGDLASWVDYLLTPETHDGPRIYACQHPGCGFDDPREARDEWLEQSPNSPLVLHQRNTHPEGFKAVSVLRGVDPHHFFYAVSAFCGMWQAAPGGMAEVYELLCTKYLLNGSRKSKAGDTYILEEDELPEGRDKVYRELGFMREPWATALESHALDYEEAMVKFATGHENCMYVLAEALAKYRAIFMEARDHVGKLMVEVTKAFDERLRDPSPSAGTVDWFAIVLSGIVNTILTVVTAGQNAVLAGAVSVAAEAVSQDDGVKALSVSSWEDLAKAFFERMDQIGDNAVKAVHELEGKLTRQLAQIRQNWGAAPPPVPAELLQFAK